MSLDTVKKESIKEVTKAAEMFERHYEGVCNALCHQQSNGKAERINGKIQEIKPSHGDIENLKTSDPLSSSSVGDLTSIHNNAGRTKLLSVRLE